MLFALLSIAVVAAGMVVFSAITESAQTALNQKDPESSNNDSDEAENDDKKREKEAQKKIAKANSVKKAVEKQAPVQSMAPIPVAKKDKKSLSNKDVISRGISPLRVSNKTMSSIKKR